MRQGLKTLVLRKKRAAEWVIGMTLMVLMMLVALFRLWDPLELMLLDLRFQVRGERKMPVEVVVVGIDEASLDHPKAGPWPWPRGLQARLLYTLNRDDTRPAALGYDFLFEGENLRDEPGDRDFAYRADEFGNSLVLGYFFEKGYRSRYEKSGATLEERLKPFALKTEGRLPKALEQYDKASLPYADLAANTSLGYLNLPREKQGSTRRLRLIAMYLGRVYPSLDLLTALRYWGAGPQDAKVTQDALHVNTRLGMKRIPVTPEGDMLISYYGAEPDSGRYFPFIQVVMADTLLAPSDEKRMRSSLRGKAVLAGRTAYALKDSHSTPFDSNESSVFVRAQGLANLLDGTFLRRAPAWVSMLCVLIFGAAALFILSSLAANRAAAALLALGAAYLAAGQLFFVNNLWIDGIVPSAALAFLFLSIVSFRYFTALEELRMAQHELLHSTKLAVVGQVSSNMAHEFRNILHALRLHVEGCAQPSMKPERIRKYMEVIFKMMNNAEEILNGILTFSRKNRSEKKPGRLKKTVEDTLLLLKKELQYQNIRVTLDLEDVPPVQYDPGQLSQVIMNLLNNARDALKGQGEKILLIRLKDDQQRIRLDIADNGPGIPKEVQARLFQPFVTSKEEGQGTGLGLSVCRGIIENHGGQITATSVPGQGTVWHIVLPK